MLNPSRPPDVRDQPDDHAGRASPSAAATSSRWSGAWLDAVAFVIGLAAAWLFHWETTDLVWSLWLSSLVIGYASLVWMITAPMREIIGGAARSGAPIDAGAVGGLSVVAAGTLFMLGFFTVHFGGFHLVHSMFLNAFFPVHGGARPGLPGSSLYGEVFRRYWWFLPAAALAEREAFRIKPLFAGAGVTVEAMKTRFGGTAMMAPYRNVVRMHLLIFFFAFAYFAHLSNFAIYAVAYAVYFFPWRLLRRERAAAAEA